MALQVGLNEEQAWRSNPGRIRDLWLWRQEYDDEIHGVRRKEGGG
jgi:hypothetical protein